jgi:outer membrane receptor for ferrienterochelin and colicins
MGHYKFVLAGLLLMFPLGAPARGGDQAKAAAAKKTGAGEEMILFQDLPSVFGASKYEQKPSEAPASVSIITSEEIQKYGYRTLSEILRSVRGFFTTNDRNYSYIGARGFDRPGDYDTRVLLLLDGHRMNDNIYDQASIGTESLVEVDAIERIEIIRGPSSSLYGTNAFLAVINVVSKSGRDLKGKEIAASGGSYSTAAARLSYGGRFDSGLETFLTGSYYDSGGQSLFYPEYNSPATNNGWARGADGDTYARLFGKMSLGNVRVEAGYSNRDKRVPTASFGTDFDDPREKTTDQRGFMDMRYDREVGLKSRFVGTMSYDGYWYKGAYPYSGALSRDYGYGEWWTAEAQSITTFHEKHKIVGGVEVRYNSQQDQGYYDTNPYFVYFKDRRQSSFWAAYVQDEFRPRDNLIVNVGVRHDNYETFGGTTNPRLGIIYAVREATTLKVLYGQAFRAPNAYELYYEDGVTQEANPGLHPESIQTYEIALEHTFHNRLRGAASVYRYGMSNVITLETDPLSLLDVFQNVDRVRSEGVELEVEGSFARFLEGRLSYALQKSEDQTSNTTLTNSPRHLAKANLSVPLSKDRLVASLEVQYTSSRQTLGGEAAGGFTLANFTLLSRHWKSGPSVSLSVFNLLDKKYGDPGGAEHVQNVIPQDGRSFRVQARYEF